MKANDDIDILCVLDHVLSAALREVRNARARKPVSVPVARAAGHESVRKSQTGMCIDILYEAGRPLHISAMLAALEALGVKPSRESLASALCKKLHPLGPFVRTAPNTFGLADHDFVKVP